jgi:hypothetical protein
MRKLLAVLLISIAVPLVSKTPVQASTETITATVGSGAAVEQHLSGTGSWTFTVVSVSGSITKAYLGFGYEADHFTDCRAVRKPTVGTSVTLPSSPGGLMYARVVVEGRAGSSIEVAVSHPSAPPAGSVVIYKPSAEPFHLGTPRWPLYVEAAVVGDGESFAPSSADLDWYDCQAAGCSLIASNMPSGYLSLSVGTHTLVAALTSPGTGPQDEYTVIVNEELTVTVGTATLDGGYATVPVSVTDRGAGIQTRLEVTLTNPDGAMRWYTFETDASGNASLVLKTTKIGTYVVHVNAMTSDGRYGEGEGSFTR